MPSHTTEITDRILSAFASDTARLPASYLLNDPGIPEVIRGFVMMELEIAVSADVQDLKQHFQLSESFESSFYRTLFIGLTENAMLTIADARKLLEHAVNDAIRFLSEPESYLLELLGQSRPEIPLDELYFHTFSYIREYHYLRDVLLAWSERKRAEGSETLSMTELRLVIRDIDRAIAGSFTVSEMQQLLAPLFVVFGGHSIPRELLQRFFYDKGAAPVVRVLRDEARTELSLTETLDLLAILMHQALTPTDEPLAPSAADPHYSEFLTELRMAGVSVAGPSEAQYLYEIQNRSAKSQ